MNGRNIAAAVAVVALLGSGAVACADPYPEGLHGKVIDRDRDTKVQSKTTSTVENGKPKTKVETETKVTYTLTTEAADGAQSAFRVSSSTYNKCHEGSQYPACFKK